MCSLIGAPFNSVTQNNSSVGPAAGVLLETSCRGVLNVSLLRVHSLCVDVSSAELLPAVSVSLWEESLSCFSLQTAAGGEERLRTCPRVSRWTIV